MKHQAVVYLVAVTMAFLVGCHSMDLNPIRSPNKYTITSVIVDAKSIPESVSLPEDLENTLQSGRNRITRMPTAHIYLGEEVEVNQQEPVTFPIRFNEDGSVKEETTIGVGKRLEVALAKEPPHRLRIYLEDMQIKARRPTVVGREPFLPRTQAHGFRSRLQPKAVLKPALGYLVLRTDPAGCR